MSKKESSRTIGLEYIVLSKTYPLRIPVRVFVNPRHAMQVIKNPLLLRDEVIEKVKKELPRLDLLQVDVVYIGDFIPNNSEYIRGNHE